MRGSSGRAGLGPLSRPALPLGPYIRVNAGRRGPLPLLPGWSLVVHCTSLTEIRSLLHSRGQHFASGRRQGLAADWPLAADWRRLSTKIQTLEELTPRAPRHATPRDSKDQLFVTVALAGWRITWHLRHPHHPTPPRRDTAPARGGGLAMHAPTKQSLCQSPGWRPGPLGLAPRLSKLLICAAGPLASFTPGR